MAIPSLIPEKRRVKGLYGRRREREKEKERKRERERERKKIKLTSSLYVHVEHIYFTLSQGGVFIFPETTGIFQIRAWKTVNKVKKGKKG
jgi:hypothetical protein